MQAVRFLVGDTNTSDQLLSDEEIQYVLDNLSSSVTFAAAICCESIAAKYSRQADTDNMSLRVSASQRAKAYLKLAAELRARGSRSASVFVGGRTIAGKDALAADSAATQPAFALGQDDYLSDSDTDGSST